MEPQAPSRRLSDHAKTGAVGVGVPGLVDGTGLVRFAPNLPGLAGTPLIHALCDALPGWTVWVGNDATAACWAECDRGAARGEDEVLMVTLGTGIGGGAVINGEMLHGLLHPEMGHVPVPRYPRDDYQGYCTFHRDCLEGMASGVAIQDRWKRRPETLPPDHEAWELEAYYLARGICAMIYTLSPQIIICGGGVMRQKQLFPLIRRQVVEMLHGYVQSEEIIDKIDRFIVEPGLGRRSGVVGALELAERAEKADRHLI